MLYNRAMRRVAVVVGLLGMWACTKENPAANCINGACLDPDFPFCDMTGDVGGIPGACTVAPDCTPSTVVCANGTLTTCDETGTVSDVETCALGCEDQFAACKQYVPANDIQQFVDMLPTAPVDLTFDQGTFYADNGVFEIGFNNDVPLPSVDVPAPPGGTAYRLVIGKHITIGTATIAGSPTEPTPNQGSGRTLVFYATDGIDLTGRLTVLRGSMTDCLGAAGDQSASTSSWTSGGGGGGNATAGAPGGDVLMGGSSIVVGGDGGKVKGTEDLVPLRGGCSGGDAVGILKKGGAGGGAIQLSSPTTIHIAGAIVVDGRSGGGGGGGAGGGILLDAPDVVLDATALLLARGGGGRAGGPGQAVVVHDDAHAIPGEPCTDPATCGDGGDGAAPGIEAKAGGFVGAVSTSTKAGGGGGGGGLGRIRINTLSGDVDAPLGVVMAGDFTAGTIGTK